MIDSRSYGRSPAARSRRSGAPAATSLAEIDRQLLDVLCTHRVVRQDQLCRLFPDVPERTLRYRTRRLHDLGLAGRTRPYREQGSAPNHHWPTRRADGLMRGEPEPRGGERKCPNPSFLAHAAALTELYVSLSTAVDSAALSLQEYHREARAPFENPPGKKRVLAPDAIAALVDLEGRKLSTFVEIDLGTMSHTRLRAKAELYAAYATTGAWREHFLFLPALLFLTTSDSRARKFLKALAHSLSYSPRQDRRRAFVAGAAGIAWAPHRLLAEPCLIDLDGMTGVRLLDVLSAAYAPYERACEHERKQREVEEERLRALRNDSAAIREHIRSHESSLRPYLEALGPRGEQTMRLLLAANSPPDVDEGAVLRSIARDLDMALLEPGLHLLPSPGPPVVSDVELLADLYRSQQGRLVAALIARHENGPNLRQARRVLQDGGLMARDVLDGLPADIERDSVGRQTQDTQRAAYMRWREQAARRLARTAGPLGRLTHRPEDFYAQIDREHLKVCKRCDETVYPSAHETQDISGRHQQPPCHYCGNAYGLRDYTDTVASSPHE